jgi:hypothetical protein
MTHKRRSPIPLPMPVFGAPAGGRQCVQCKKWFDRKVFWRRNSKSYVQRCPDCLATRLPNTKNPGKKKPREPVSVIFGNNDLAAVIMKGIKPRPAPKR